MEKIKETKQGDEFLRFEKDGKVSYFDYKDGKWQFWGDLEISESAKLFFENIEKYITPRFNKLQSDLKSTILKKLPEEKIDNSVGSVMGVKLRPAPSCDVCKNKTSMYCTCLKSDDYIMGFNQAISETISLLNSL